VTGPVVPIVRERTRLDMRLVPAAVGSWLITTLGVLSSIPVAGAAAGTASVSTMILIVVLIRGSRMTLLPMLIGLSGTLAGFGWAMVVRQHHIASNPLAGGHAHGTKATITVRIADDPKIIARTNRVVVAVSVARIRGDAVPEAAATVLAPMDGWLELIPGQQVSAVFTVSEPLRPDLTVATLTTSGTPEVVRGPPAYQRWAGMVRARFLQVSSQALGEPEWGLLPGLVLGDTSALNEDLKDDFRTCGLTHLTAVSGANFAIIIGVLLLMLRWLGVGPRVAVALTAIAIVVFVILVRPSPSVVRAAVMGGVGLSALLMRRHSQAMPALCAAIMALLMIWPAFAVQPGFILSVIATAGLVVIAPVVAQWLRTRRVPAGVAELLAVAVVAQVVTTPAVLLFSGQISVVAIVANLAVALVVAPITVLGTAAAVVALVCPPVAVVLARFTGPELWWMVVIADKLSRVPFATLSLW
jgi:competence protein ComEC